LNALDTSRLQRLLDSQQQSLLKNGLKGIEKESLRLSESGLIAQTKHPSALGSALTHPYITTDYSEALLEFITPPFKKVEQSINFMHNIHRYVYQHLDNEYLLTSSMPCGVQGDESIPIAQYGQSNIGQMKHIYRKGLAHRYGRTMQAIAGIHFNYSVPTDLWPVLHQLEASQQSLEDFQSSAYFDLIRNFQRQGWLILYLFGASPAICKNFFTSRPKLMSQFEEFDAGTLYHPYATSLRMSDIGYKSNNQANLNIDYNSLDGYVDSLSNAINSPYPEYEHFGVKVDGDYQQLNANTLQIENEFYSTVRPKQIINPCEKPTLALKRRGVLYVEIRSLDLNPFNPIGIDSSTAYFIEAFLLSCLLQNSPPSTVGDSKINNSNQLIVAHKGRQADVELLKGNQSVRLHDWANEILDTMQTVCSILDENEPEAHYTLALEEQRQRVNNPNLTPSAQLLAQMRENKIPFAKFADSLSEEHANNLRTESLSPEFKKNFNSLAQDSKTNQAHIEASDQLTFDDFLTHYFSQA